MRQSNEGAQDPGFDEAAAFENLKFREMAKAVDREEMRKKLLEKTIAIFLKEFENGNMEIWLIGSITRSNQFSQKSDIDIVVKGYNGDRFDLWILLEAKIGHAVEIIRYEECDFQDDILKYGLKVI